MTPSLGRTTHYFFDFTSRIFRLKHTYLALKQSTFKLGFLKEKWIFAYLFKIVITEVNWIQDSIFYCKAYKFLWKILSWVCCGNFSKGSNNLKKKHKKMFYFSIKFLKDWISFGSWNSKLIETNIYYQALSYIRILQTQNIQGFTISTVASPVSVPFAQELDTTGLGFKKKFLLAPLICCLKTHCCLLAL